MFTRLHNRAREEQGFTLTEAKTSVRQGQTAMETFSTDNQTYVATKAQLVDIEQSLAAAPGNSFTVTSRPSTPTR
jgi:hypothetical protein